ncbi:MAG: ATP-binding cassette domain-containing protein [Clostridium butyricum]|nr:ATP-binding cassette domain-containing protein [Clostridium butyricum]
MENIIEVKNLSKNFGEFKAVDSISFNVKRGELFGFLGVNGAGKSTTINILSTLLKNFSGKIKICGLNLRKDDAEIRKRIGIVFQNNSLDDLLTVKENLISRAYLYGDDKKKIKKNLDNVCEILKIGEHLNKQFKYLSGGQKRSCDIARALMNTPEILFLDEPTTGLDPKTRKNLWDCIEYLRAENNMTIFLTTHYMEEAAKAQNISIIDRGKIVESGTPFKLKEEYACDQLKIEPENIEEVKKVLDVNNLSYSEDVNRIMVAIPYSLYSIQTLKELEKHIRSFEVVQGTMDDAFLNITGKTLFEN